MVQDGVQWQALANTMRKVTSGFRREGYEICALLGCYAAYSGNSLPKFRDLFLIFFLLEFLDP